VAKLQVALVSPEREVWTGEADVVDARTLSGELGILPGHTELFGVLVDGSVVTITSEDSEPLRVMVTGGFLSVAHNEVSILPSSVELADEIDVSAARTALSDAESVTGDSDDDPELAVRRARARLEAAGQEV
jgi:F-type H+-transporting ATPase subunit epsilon